MAVELLEDVSDELNEAREELAKLRDLKQYFTISIKYGKINNKKIGEKNEFL